MKAFHEVRTYDSDFMVWNSSYQNISFLAHWHQEIEFILIRSGSAHLSINDHTFTAHQGDLVVIDTGDFHYSDSSEQKNTLEFIIFDTSIISSIYTHTHYQHPLITAEMLRQYGLEKELFTLYEIITAELDRKSPYYQEIITASLRSFWYRLKRQHPRNNAEEQNRRAAMLYDLQQLLSYIEDHYTENITLAFASEKMGFSESYFSRLFKKLIGINFITYLNMVRIEHAAGELKKTSRKITDIALGCGFNNIRSFNRTFKEITGYAPREFISLADPDSYNLTYYKRKSSQQEFVKDHSLTVVKNTP